MKTPFVERFVATAALIAVSPALALVGLLIRLESPGPVLYRARRLGLNGQPFDVLKLRSMVERGETPGPRITVGGDSRVTRVGRFIRSTKIDEMPQFLNVARGEMRLVGPRPEDEAYVNFGDPEHQKMLSVQPGITSPASLRFRDEEAVLKRLVATGASLEDAYLEVAAEKRSIDLEYAATRTWRTDLGVLWRTATSVACRWRRHGAGNRTNG